MADRDVSDPALVTQTASRIVARLTERSSEVSQQVMARLKADIPELRGDAPLLDVLGASVEGNVATIFHSLQYDIPIERVEAPTAAMEYARRLAQRGVSANILVRAYRLGHQTVLDAVLEEIRQARLASALSLDVYEWITTVSFRYIDWITVQVTEIYERERDRWLESRNSVRAARVREVLSAGEVDVDAVTASIRYPLRRTHLAVVMWLAADGEQDGLARLERSLREMARVMQVREAPLFIAADQVSGWGWISLSPSAVDGAVEAARQFAESLDGTRTAFGAPLPGLDGFRRSHRQAMDARRVAVVAGDRGPMVSMATEPGLAMAALLAPDLAEARAWVGDILGPLASDTESDARLRETLRVFLRADGSYKAASDELMLHSNSVKYRVQRAIERRGRSIDDDRLDVEVALMMCHRYGSAMLAG
ncbi:PucR family transcriptional regulator [Mycobacteroides franklinii]|uniref:PucR family transcriptional regulator n=1 Tax=Mycobacteroides franklinii TaxID=948102 RepID=UPI0009943E91|nr:helix-turn-helix domain-containing protein [Mycobacteroides franklinii]